VNDPPRILLIRPSALGDVARTVPVLVSLRRHYPEATIDWLVQDAFTDAIIAHPALSEAIPFARRDYGGAWGWMKSLGWLRGLRRRRYDVVYDCQGLLRSAIFARVTGAARRYGYRSAREGAARAYTDRVDVSEIAHTVDQMLELVRASGVEIVRDMTLYVPESSRASWARRRIELGITGPYALLAPTSRWAGKNWPAERYADTASWLLENGFDHVLVAGAKSERDQCQPLLERTVDDPGRIIDLMGATTVGELMAAIDGARCVVANDSAALHIAVGLDRPIVALFGATDPARVGPYLRTDDVIRGTNGAGPVSHKDEDRAVRLMEQITVDAVTRRIAEITSVEHGRDTSRSVR
jgi:heptosyltransferase-1